MHKSETDIPWLETALRRGLHRVSAPRELWDRVTLPRVEAQPSGPQQRTSVWMLAAASVAAASVMAVAWGYHPHARADFKSDQASLVREWIRNRTGIDVPLAAQPDSRIEIIGAGIGHAGVVEVRYRASGRDVSLMVGRAGAGRPHGEFETIDRATTASWTAGHHVFTLSVHRPGDMRVACLVCHADAMI